MITKKEVKRIADLARIGATESEIEKLQNDLSSVLDYIEKLEKVDVAGLEPTSHPLKLENAMRADEVKKEPNKLIEGFLRVSPVRSQR